MPVVWAMAVLLLIGICANVYNTMFPTSCPCAATPDVATNEAMAPQVASDELCWANNDLPTLLPASRQHREIFPSLAKNTSNTHLQMIEAYRTVHNSGNLSNCWICNYATGSGGVFTYLPDLCHLFGTNKSALIITFLCNN